MLPLLLSVLQSESVAPDMFVLASNALAEGCREGLDYEEMPALLHVPSPLSSLGYLVCNEIIKSARPNCPPQRDIDGVHSVAGAEVPLGGREPRARPREPSILPASNIDFVGIY